MSIETPPIGLKVVLLGDAAAGKSSLLLRYTTGQFNQRLESTIGASFKSKVVTRNGKCIRLDIWDTAGQERYRSILPMYYRQAAAAILVIDVSDKQSLRVADRWIMDIRQKTEGTDCYIIMAVNKVDLPERAITPDIVADFCREKGVDSIETSALSGYQVQELFDRVCDNCMETEISETKQENVIHCSPKPEVKPSKCC
ncbi:Rab5 [Blastocystis sp. ATCC 50177/Nand II]|uniref:Rab5 n=1 Tax=Blastocystis sp. subtype 1 (strain ATCC 50177 / NandII) TaxID=478820 RepID=A0A196SEM4_BLAHN|nr:Rab5 [Blastocystis sp. ATCC 50177/Nand II]